MCIFPLFIIVYADFRCVIILVVTFRISLSSIFRKMLLQLLSSIRWITMKGAPSPHVTLLLLPKMCKCRESSYFSLAESSFYYFWTFGEYLSFRLHSPKLYVLYYHHALLFLSHDLCRFATKLCHRYLSNLAIKESLSLSSIGRRKWPCCIGESGQVWRQ